MLIELMVIFEIALVPTMFHFVQWRLRNVHVPAFDQLGHLPVKKRQQQRTNMAAVHIGISHDDDAVVSQLIE